MHRGITWLPSVAGIITPDFEVSLSSDNAGYNCLRRKSLSAAMRPEQHLADRAIESGFGFHPFDAKGRSLVPLQPFGCLNDEAYGRAPKKQQAGAQQLAIKGCVIGPYFHPASVAFCS